MNRRQLKKSINYLCGELFAECVAITHFNRNIPREDVDNIMKSILLMQDDLICRCSHVEPGSTKLYFKKLREDMIEATDGIVDNIKSLA